MGLLSFIDDVLKIVDPEYAQEAVQRELMDNHESENKTCNKLYNTGDIINAQSDKNKVVVSVEDCTIHHPWED